MKKADKNIWNDTWDKFHGHISISDMDNLIFRELKKSVEFREKEIIELGCGKGVLSFLMLKNGAKACTLVDFSESAINIAREILGNADNVEFVCLDLFDIDETKKYDIAFSSGVAEHFSDKLRLDVIYKHLRMTKDIAILIVPARPHFNTIRHRKKRIMALYGWQYSFSKREMNDIVNKLDGYDIVMNKRIYPLYSLNLFELFSIDSKFIFFHLWNQSLYLIDRILRKLRFYKVFNMLLFPFSNLFGGLLITIIKKRCY